MLRRLEPQWVVQVCHRVDNLGTTMGQHQPGRVVECVLAILEFRHRELAIRVCHRVDNLDTSKGRHRPGIYE